MDIVKKVLKFITEEKMPSTSSRILIGLSGGADSVAMTQILKTIGYDIEALHCNFHLRGEESDRDEEFVRQLTRSMQIPCQVIHFDTQSYCREKKISVEMGARELRYSAFADTMKEHQLSAVAIAHHLDDTIETMLLNLIRGTGLAGLTGIPTVNGHVFRPILCLFRQEIEEYLHQNQIPFITDSSNLSTDFLRNKIRLELIPYLKTLNPSIEETLVQTIDILKGVEKTYGASVQEFMEQQRSEDPFEMDIRRLLQTPSAGAILFEWLKDFGFTSTHVKNIRQGLNNPSGLQYFSKTHRLIKDRSTLYLEAIKEDPFDQVCFISQNQQEIYSPIRLSIKRVVKTDHFVIDKSRSTAMFDVSQLRFPLVLRKWKEGDSFFPFGMNGRKKVSDLLTDLKVPLHFKEQVYVLQSGEDIIWVIGYRTGNIGKVTDRTTEVLQLSF